MTQTRHSSSSGASLAGAKAAETMREEGFDGEHRAVGEETRAALRAPAAVQGLPARQGRAREGLRARRAAGTPSTTSTCGSAPPSTAIDPAARGPPRRRRAVGYDRLLLATGVVAPPARRPRRRPGRRALPATVDDSDALLAAFAPGGGRVVVVGAGWIGLEVAAAARAVRRRGDRRRAAADRRCTRSLGPEVGEVFAEPAPRATASTFRFGERRRRVRRRQRRPRGRRRRTVDGDELPADVRRRRHRRRAQRRAGRGGRASRSTTACVVDAALRTSDPDIFAAGDVANACHPLLGRRIRVEHWANALNGGTAAARVDARPAASPTTGCPTSSPTSTTSAWSTPGSPRPGYDQVVFRGDARRPGVHRLLAARRPGRWPA